MAFRDGNSSLQPINRSEGELISLGRRTNLSLIKYRLSPINAMLNIDVGSSLVDTLSFRGGNSLVQSINRSKG